MLGAWLAPRRLAVVCVRASMCKRYFAEAHDNNSIHTKLLTYLDRMADDMSKGSFNRAVQDHRENLRRNLADLRDLETIAADNEQDSELRLAAQDDLVETRQRTEDIVSSLATLVTAQDAEAQYDSNNAILEVTAGAGGLEASLFASEVFHMYVKFLQSHPFCFQVEVTELKPSGTPGGILHAVASVTGSDVFRSVKFECGVHRVQRVPVTGTKSDRLQTSTCSVTVVPQHSYDDFFVDEKELKFEYMRSSGPGGQSVNKTDSAVRVTHLPTGFVTECQEERSQMRNKSKAISKIKDMIFKKKFEEDMDKVSSSRKSQVRSLNRNEKIRTYNFSRHMITDHRLGLSKQVPNLAEFLEGVGEFEALKVFHRQLIQTHELEQLQNILENEKIN